jgi:hypothetical protein
MFIKKAVLNNPLQRSKSNKKSIHLTYSSIDLIETL